MDNVTFIEVQTAMGDLETYAKIDHGNEQYTTMLKSTYDELKANEAKTI
jgi:hypothetical protein